MSLAGKMPTRRDRSRWRERHALASDTHLISLAPLGLFAAVALDYLPHLFTILLVSGINYVVRP